MTQHTTLNTQHSALSTQHPKQILVTGSAGFIGFHLSRRLLDEGHEVIGVDNLNDYYDPNLKKARLAVLKKYKNFTFYEIDISNRKEIETLFNTQHSKLETRNSKLETRNFDSVVHLAAQAGVRYSLINPHAYIDSNINGFINILEGCRHNNVKHLVYASSSSVYGANTSMPFSVHHNVDHPVSLYAATKRRMNSWRIPIQAYITFPVPDSDSSLYMAHGAGRIWHYFYSQKP